MATEGRSPVRDDSGEVLPDEAAVIAERIDELEDTESHLSVEEVADDLDIDLD
jgi:hypothetical protein